MACTSYVHDIGNSDDLFAIQVAFMAYLVGHVLVGKQLYDGPHTVRGEQNKHWPWIEEFIAQEHLRFIVTRRG